MERILTWFYCLPMGQAAVLLLLAAGGFYTIWTLWGNRRWFAPAAAALFVLWIGAMACATLIGRGEPGAYPVNLIPLHSYRELLSGGNVEILRSNFMNGVLFFPGGVLLGVLLPPKWSAGKRIAAALAFFAVLSAGVEGIQYLFRLGRVEADDLLHNVLGALLGLGVMLLPAVLRRRNRK